MINAEKAGNLSRFVNHSCQSNIIAEKVFIGQSNVIHVVFHAVKNIPPGEELTVDYGDTFWLRKRMECFCGSDNCRYKFAYDEDEEPNIIDEELIIVDEEPNIINEAPTNNGANSNDHPIHNISD